MPRSPKRRGLADDTSFHVHLLTVLAVKMEENVLVPNHNYFTTSKQHTLGEITSSLMILQDYYSQSSPVCTSVHSAENFRGCGGSQTTTLTSSQPCLLCPHSQSERRPGLTRAFVSINVSVYSRQAAGGFWCQTIPRLHGFALCW